MSTAEHSNNSSNRDPKDSAIPGTSKNLSFDYSIQRLGSWDIEKALQYSEIERCILSSSLLEALMYRDVKTIELLLSEGADPNATCRFRYISAVHLAALRSDSALDVLLSHGAYRINTDCIGRTPLHFAAWAGHQKHVAMLLGISTDLMNRLTVSPMTIDIEAQGNLLAAALKEFVNAQCDKSKPRVVAVKPKTCLVDHQCKEFEANLPVFEAGWTPLHAASARANFQCVRFLLAAGANPLLQDAEDRIPLDIVGIAHYSDDNIDPIKFAGTVKAFASRCPKFSIHNKKIVNSPLHTAVELESIDAVKVLMKLDMPVNRLNGVGLTAVHICVKKKLPEILKVIINEKLQEDTDILHSVVDVRDKNGYTALHAAVEEEWMEGICIIIDAGADMTAKDNNGDTPLHLAATIGNLNCLNKILNTIKFTNITNQLEKALFRAVENGHVLCVERLLKEKASLKRTIQNQFNVFHLAASRGFVDILQILLDYDLDITKDMINYYYIVTKIHPGSNTRELGFGPIHYAIQNNHTECVKLILSKYTLSDFKTSLNGIYKGSSPLHIAAIYNCVKIAQILINHDPESIGCLNTWDWTPLHYACNKGNKEMIVLLLEHGADLSGIARSMRGKRNITAIELLMNGVSKPTEFLENIFNSCIRRSNDDIWPNFELTLNYQVLAPNDDSKEQMKVIEALLKTGDRHKQRRLLTHPLIESFLNLKSMAILPFFYAVVCIYAVYILIFTIYILVVFNIYVTEDNIIHNITNILAMTALIYIFAIIFIILEIWYISINARYFKELETWIKLGAMMLTLTLPVFILIWKGNREYLRQIASLALLLSWLEMMFLLSRIPKLGYCMLMFGKVARDVLKILLTFSCLVIGFSFSFMIQFHNNPPFYGLSAFIKTFTMIASFDYDALVEQETDIIVSNGIKKPSNILEKLVSPVMIFQLIFAAFILLAVIVLMNIMIGVAVNDLHDLQVHGNTQRLIKQVECVVSLDSLLSNVNVASMLPATLKKRLLELETVPSEISFSKNDTDLIIYRALSSDSINYLFEIAQTRDCENATRQGSK